MARQADPAPFSRMLIHHHLDLRRAETHTLQINVGLRCNQVCRHCHLEAGPGRSELMDRSTMAQVIAYAARGCFEVVDITGGAPELNPHLLYLMENLRPWCRRMLHRTNLTALLAKGPPLLEALRDLGVVIYASLPALNPRQTNAQRGSGVFESSLAGLATLNGYGWGLPDSGLELHLVSNPSGAYLPPDQEASQERFRRKLAQGWGVHFNTLACFANAPLGRFKSWLDAEGLLEDYLALLVQNFNPQALDKVMCRSLVSVDWRGRLYDCDFHLAAGISLGGLDSHVENAAGPPAEGSAIALAEHCFACTAGAGFT